MFYSNDARKALVKRTMFLESYYDVILVFVVVAVHLLQPTAVIWPPSSPEKD